MKLKKTSDTSAAEMTAVAPTTGGAIIADRFKLDAVEEVKGPAGVSKIAAALALVGALLALAAIGGVAAMMYMNWDMLQNA